MSEQKKLYSSDQITRAFKLVEILAGHELDPLSNKEIMIQTGWDGTTTTRMCQAAMSAGIVESAGVGKWRLSVSKFTNIAIAVQHGAQRARSRMEDKINNYTRSAY
ncbi:MAG: hypothetical protein COS35_07410 [Zetaproteobacteria bacterium CG02_land_8_20_14_3_00_50_9]|nr:MAG: hypothetical protein AUJ57_12095 [Zetaproteobacteria bacterium CG1_02_53_45]PIQ33660.1 MAG: hypothetical protein COW62_04615 [Zetaproteobacteria bacterium CG17_big_fil_post_rev_8_21_14_2_50_50_13]PIV30296.1 MAG: hypothetical protein COS35_07410 [Zetaproteobacteria bacterium CG02_land_8_20_14_3_00_50_9]PIY55740.1 MAG: hypothetical protein COZ00_07860 [Zetaproteobacteria bacterium CG_4_10_14_0_8_um_filter_49_80]